MRGVNSLAALAAAAALVCGVGAYAADSSSAPGKPMKMDEPMPTMMKKPGMKKGDVKKAAEKKQRELTPMIEKESADAAKR
jgi:hypothetical protein